MPKLASLTSQTLAGLGVTRFVKLGHTWVLDNPNAYDTSEGDYFGRNVSISGNYAIVGAQDEDEAGYTSSGKAYIFDVTTGALVDTLDNPNAYDTPQTDIFGKDVAISGNYAIVGASGEDDAGGTNSGKAYIFNTSLGDWSDTVLLHTLDNPNAYGTSAGDRFGEAVAISGNYAIVGADQEDEVSGGASGKAYIFNVTTGSLVHTLDNPSAYGIGAGDRFGQSVAIDGNYAIVGADAEDDAGTDQSGKAYIFDVTTGTLVVTLDNQTASGPSSYEYFGQDVAISGNYAICGAYGIGGGRAFIFKTTIGDWTDTVLLHTLNDPNAYGSSTNDQFGAYVSISGNYAIVGASFEDDDDGVGSGKAYIFDVTSGLLLYVLDNPNPYSTSTGDAFGSSVSISGNYAIVGAFGEWDTESPPIATPAPGKAYIYQIS